MHFQSYATADALDEDVHVTLSDEQVTNILPMALKWHLRLPIIVDKDNSNEVTFLFYTKNKNFQRGLMGLLFSPFQPTLSLPDET